MKAARRSGVVKVVYSSVAVVRNSSVDMTVVVFTARLLPVDVVANGFDADGLAFACVAEEDVVTVVGTKEGDAPVACWRSLPCSAIRSGPSFESLMRSLGRISLRTRALTGALGDESE